MNRLLNIFVALDKLVYQIMTLGYGSMHDTVSSAAYRMEQKGKLTGKIFRPLIDWIFALLGDEHHCFTSYINAKYNIPTKDY